MNDKPTDTVLCAAFIPRPGRSSWIRGGTIQRYDYGPCSKKGSVSVTSPTGNPYKMCRTHSRMAGEGLIDECGQVALPNDRAVAVNKGLQLHKPWETEDSSLREEPTMKKPSRNELVLRIKELADENKQLKKDCSDMMGSRCTSFMRCPKCKSLHDRNLCCSCGYDE